MLGRQTISRRRFEAGRETPGGLVLKARKDGIEMRNEPPGSGGARYWNTAVESNPIARPETVFNP